MSTAFDVAEIRSTNRSRFRLEEIRQSYLDRGNTLNRLARECISAAHECFDQAQLIEHELGAL